MKLSTARPLPHPSAAAFRLPAVLFALSDPTRLHIVRTLAAGGEMICAAIDVPLAKSSCSRHYKVLREAGIIRMRRQGTAFLNSLRREELDRRFPGLLRAVLREASAASPRRPQTTAARRAAGSSGTKK